MPRLNFCLLLTGIALLGAVATSAQQLPTALTTGPTPDKEFPPAMEAPDILEPRREAQRCSLYGLGPRACKEALQKAGNLRVTETYLETGHSYSDHRIALQVTVLKRLQTLLAPASK